MSNKNLFVLSILTFITVIAWIVSDIHHAYTTSTVTPSQKELIRPLEPSFDQEVILRLRERKEI